MRQRAQAQAELAGGMDPITLEVVCEGLIAIVKEMRQTIIRASYSSVIYEFDDFSCAIFDPAGQMVAQSWDHPGHVLPLPAMAPPHTPFQARLRQALLAIPSGETKTYGELAGMLRSSPRAVGQALGANPLPILIPCHRVVAIDGLGGFGGGLAWKQHLLNLESIRPYR